MTAARPAFTIGYACAWWHPRETTWSYTAARLRDALGRHVTVVDLEAQRSAVGKAAMKAVHAPIPGLFWKYSPVERALMDRRVRRGLGRHAVDAVIGIAEADTITPAPTFLYQDMNAALLAAPVGGRAAEFVNLMPSRPWVYRSMAAAQRRRLRSAAGVFAMSRWYADLLEDQGAAPDRVWVTPAGMNNPPSEFRDEERPVRGDVLFVGTDFRRKGGDQVLEAVRRLNAAGDPVRLTIVGPREWPGSGPVPAWVDFRGYVGGDEVGRLLAHHDVFAMPSRFEAFGIALVEALVAGLPCVARAAYAMPEIVTDRVTGALVETDDPDELAVSLRRILEDRGVHARVALQRPLLIERHDWDAVAARMVDRMREAVDEPRRR